MGSEVVKAKRRTPKKTAKRPRRVSRGPLSVRAEKKFLEVLAQHGQVQVAADATGVAANKFYCRARVDPEFAEAWQIARRIGAERALDMHLKPRGFEGWEEPVFQKGVRVMDVVLDGEGNVVYEEDKYEHDGIKRDKNGNKIPKLKPALIRRYCPRAAELWARHSLPHAFGTKHSVEISGPGGGPIKHAHLHAEVSEEQFMDGLRDKDETQIAGMYKDLLIEDQKQKK